MFPPVHTFLSLSHLTSRGPDFHKLGFLKAPLANTVGSPVSAGTGFPFISKPHPVKTAGVLNPTPLAKFSTLLLSCKSAYGFKSPLESIPAPEKLL